MVRMPVYPKINYNSGKPYCSPSPYPVGTGPGASCTPSTTAFSAADYVSHVLKPAVDYATGLSLYVIIDFHQIDNATSGTSAADANTFWADIAPQFASYTNVLYEIFNEPIDTSVPWSTRSPSCRSHQHRSRRRAGQHHHRPFEQLVPAHGRRRQRPTDRRQPHVHRPHLRQQLELDVPEPGVAASAKVPVFVSEWGYSSSDSASFGPGLQTTLDGDGASWTAWVTDNSWAPAMFTNQGLTTLSTFGTQVKTWLAATATSDWVQ